MLEQKGVSVYGQNVSTLYLIQILRVSSKAGSRGEKRGFGSGDMLEKKWVSV
jgi:hypothetical protein